MHALHFIYKGITMFLDIYNANANGICHHLQWFHNNTFIYKAQAYFESKY